MSKEKYRYLSKNILLFSISSFGTKLLSFFLVPVYTNFLSVSEYGIIDMVVTTVNLLVPIFTFNISEGVMRFTMNDKKDTRYLSYGIYVIMKGSIILGIFLLFGFLCFKTEYLIWVFLLFFINSMYICIQNYLRATDQISSMVTASIMNSLIMLVLNILLIAILKINIIGYFMAMFSGMLAAVLYMCGRDKICSCVTYKIANRQEIRDECLRYCIPTIFTSLAWWINSSLDRYFVTGICGVSQNGIYSVSYKIPTVLGVFQNIFMQAWTLSAITEFDKDDKDGFFAKTYKMYNSMMIIVCSVIIVVNIPLSKFLYANEFFKAWKCVPVLLASTLFSALGGYIGGIFSAVKDTKTSAFSTVISAVVNIILDIFLIPVAGILGAAVATFISYLVAWMVRMVVLRKYIHMKLDYKKNILAYLLIVFQVICATSKKHFYVMQIGVMVMIVLLQYKVYVAAIRKLYTKYLIKR